MLIILYRETHHFIHKPGTKFKIHVYDIRVSFYMKVSASLLKDGELGEGIFGLGIGG